jgi:hypothetical protein
VRNEDIRVTVDSRVPRRARLIMCQNLGGLRRLAEGVLERSRGPRGIRAGRGRAVWNGAENMQAKCIVILKVLKYLVLFSEGLGP